MSDYIALRKRDRWWSKDSTLPFPFFPVIKLTDALSNVLSPTPIAKTGRPWKVWKAGQALKLGTCDRTSKLGNLD